MALTKDERLVPFFMSATAKNYMTQSNTDKSRDGNDYQKVIFNRLLVAPYKFKEIPRNNVRHCVEEDKYYSDITFVLESHPNTMIVVEFTTSLRNDRLSGKQYQASCIQASLRDAGYKDCIYILAMADDSYHIKSGRLDEIKLSNYYINKVNRGYTNHPELNHIHMACKESQLSEVIATIDKCKNKMAKTIITKTKSKIKI